MRVAVIGAGVIGVTTAWELTRDGHDVTVFERRGSVAAENSFANGGLVTPGFVAPWTSPGMPRQALRQLFDRHPALRLRPTLGWSTLAWAVRWWRACTPANHLANRPRMLRLARYSHERLHELTRELHLDYERTAGCLMLLRSPRDLAAARPVLSLLAETGIRFALVDAQRCRAIEPGLNPDTALHAGVHLPEDEVGNCRQFSHLLRGEAQRLGARFMFHTEVRALHAGSRPEVEHRPASLDDSNLGGTHDEDASTARLRLAAAEVRREAFDAVVVCAAVASTGLLRPLGVRLPLAPLWGYSVTAPLRHLEAHPDAGPRSAVVDERYKVTLSRIGQRVRVSGSAELGGRAGRFRPGAVEALYEALDDWFPGSAHLAQAQRWQGASPMLPDGPPVLGSSGAEGIWLNLGHGAGGWALACGSARVLADVLAGRPAAIDIAGLDIGRLR